MAASESGRRSHRGSVAPLYKQLPQGPHRLDHNQVLRNQRARIQGAMVEAIVASGYEHASVRQVVALAGVSRRSFYELFANKQGFFVATSDVIAARGMKGVRRAYQASEGDLEDRLSACYEEFVDGVKTNWNDARLTIVRSEEHTSELQSLP